ncbi:MAG: YihY/virulence factor BrkB family protein, partial [Solirubrobacteraceae bacterium]
HRTTGHAAEMAFFAVVTLVPSTVAVGSALGLSKSVIGDRLVFEAEDAAISAIQTLMGPELADTVITPFVHLQLSQPRGGVAIGGLLIAWWLSMRLFEATGTALDVAYHVRSARATLLQRVLALGFALGSVALVALTVEVTVAVGWAVLRVPLLLAVVIGFLISLYRFSPNVRHTWRECVPGALVGAVLWIVAAVVFRISAELGMRAAAGGVAANDPSMILIGQSINAVVATVLWAYLASIAILIGGEFNAALRTRRLERSVVDAPAPERELEPVETR